MSTQLQREMTSSPAVAGSIPKSNLAVQTNKETNDMDADFVDPKNTNSHKHAFAIESSMPVVQNHGNQGRDLMRK